MPPLPAAPEPGEFGAARAVRGKRASGPGVSCFPLKCALDASAKRAHQTTDTSYGKPFLNCPGWLPTAQDSCQGSLLKMESYFHILLPAGRAPESCHFPICHWILHVSKSNPCLSPAGDAAQSSLESGLSLNINHRQACDCLSRHSSARGTQNDEGQKMSSRGLSLCPAGRLCLAPACHFCVFFPDNIKTLGTFRDASTARGSHVTQMLLSRAQPL